MKQALLIIFTLIAVLPVIYIVFTRNIIRAVFSLATSFLGLAGIYVLLNAEFMAVVQILIYVGGIIVLMVFGLMLTKSSYSQGFITTHRYPILGTLIGVIILGLLMLIGFRENLGQTDIATYSNSINDIGRLYLTEFILAFEVVAFLLLVALVGASFLAKQSADE